MTPPLPTPLAAVEAMARAIEGPHRPVPVGCKWTLGALRALRWNHLSRQEQGGRRNEAQSALTALCALYPGVAEVIAGSAVVVLKPSDKPEFEVGQTWVPTSGRAEPRTIMWVGKAPRHWYDMPCVGWSRDPENPTWDKDGFRHDSYLPVATFKGWIKKRKAGLASSPYAPPAPAAEGVG